MLFITLCKSRAKPTKELSAKASNSMKLFEKEGGKIVGFYWTLGRYDSVVIFEAKDEKDAMKAAIAMSELGSSTETLVAVPREEALKLLEYP